MALDPHASIEANAAEIVRLPDGADFTRDNHGELLELLFGTADVRDPAKYAEIFRIASQDPSASTWMHFMARSEHLNGRRRIKGADMAEIAIELETLTIEAGFRLENTGKKYTLLGGMTYNHAIVLRGLRRYTDAASAQRMSSAWYGLAGDVPKQLTAIFVAQVEEVTAAFVGGVVGTIERSIRALIAARDHVFYALPEYPGWMKDNASIHIAWAIAMANMAYPFTVASWPEYGDDVRVSVQSRSVQWVQAIRVTMATDEEVINQVPIELASSSADNAALTVQIFRALAERRQGNTEAANERLKAVADHQGPDGGIPIAVAKKLLDQPQ